MVHIGTIHFVAVFASLPPGYWLEWRYLCLVLGGEKDGLAPSLWVEDPCLALAGRDNVSFKQG